MTFHRGVAAVAAAVLTLSCSSGTASIGPVTIEVPSGWRVTSSGGDNLQIADGSTGGVTGTAAGTATAVFDVYVNSTVSAETYTESLRKDNVGVKSERITVDGDDAVRLSYSGAAAAGRQEAVFIPSHDVRIVYRAAFANDNTAFLRGRAAFRRAVASIDLGPRPPRA